MDIVAKFKETALSVVPVMAIVLVLSLFAVDLGAKTLLSFFFGGLLLIVGLSIFLLGVDIGIQPVGSRLGSALTHRRSFALMLGSAFAIGFIVTAAEPDIQVFGAQVRSIFAGVDKRALVFSIAGGVGLFMTLGVARMFFNLSVKWVLLISYTLLFILAYFAPKAFVGIAFDSGGATTGPMTVPFIMALGIGVAAVRADRNGGFGLTGIASVGPIMAVLAYSLFADTFSGVAAVAATGETHTLWEVFKDIFSEALVSILPLYGLFVVYQLFLLKLTAFQFGRITIGFAYALIGLTIFLFGVNSGFMQAGRLLGVGLGENAENLGGVWYLVLIATGLAFGAIIVCAEPAVWVLSEQVEEASGGAIKRKTLLVFLAAGTAIAIGLAMLRAVFGFSIAYLLVPGYVLAMVLMCFTPTLFAGIAFDSGGVASGPLTSTFILSFTLGAASRGEGVGDSFGVIALVAMMPLIAIQLMGILYQFRRNRAGRSEQIANGGAK